MATGPSPTWRQATVISLQRPGLLRAVVDGAGEPLAALADRPVPVAVIGNRQ